ncbi:hypothetical protein SLA2020_378100 [Shorea laevis]
MPPSSGGIILSPPGHRLISTQPPSPALVMTAPARRVSARLASSPPSNPGMFSFFNSNAEDSDDSNSVSEELSDSDLQYLLLLFLLSLDLISCDFPSVVVHDYLYQK